MKTDFKITPHGGGCCGILHISNFNVFSNSISLDEKKEAIQKVINEIADLSERPYLGNGDFEYPSFEYMSGVGGCIDAFYEAGCPSVCKEDHIPSDVRVPPLLEVTLTLGQYYDYWCDALKGCGFKEVNRFRNPHSGNHIVVFHYIDSVYCNSPS